MISAFANSWRVPELRERIVFTLAMIVIVRLGVYIPLPGVDPSVISDYIKDKSENPDTGSQLGAMFNIFSGGGLQNMGIFALGIMPYISASIMMQLLSAVVPKLAKLQREDGGRQKINQYTRAITIIIALVQGWMLSVALKNPDSIPFVEGIEKFGTLVPDPTFTWQCIVTLTIVAGALFIMWIGDQITDRGIGNGVSMIITVNIIAALPGALVITWQLLIGGEDKVAGPLTLVFLVAFLLFVIAATIAITQAQRRIAIQYAKRVVGRKMLGGQTQYLPLKINYSGVMPIIFATAILALPAFILSTGWARQWSGSTSIADFISPASWGYYLVAGLMIFFFSYFWVATMFQPSQISEDLKKSGGYIPGVRPGPPTAQFLDFTMTRLTFAGSIFLLIIFVLPYFVGQALRLPFIVTQFFGGTSLLIIVGVLLDFMRQVETHLLQRNYDGFLRKGKIKSRYEKQAQQGAAGAGVKSTVLLALMGALIVFGIVAWNLNS